MQGENKAYDPGSGDGVVVDDRLIDERGNQREYDLAPDAHAGSVFRLLRQGQRVIFDLDPENRATGLSLGSEIDMGTPDLPPLPHI
jgi:CspA family cold shock protein